MSLGMALKNQTIFSKKEFGVHKLRWLRFLAWSSRGPLPSQLVSIVYFRPPGGRTRPRLPGEGEVLGRLEP